MSLDGKIAEWKWNSMDTAPKDRSVLLDIGRPMAVVGKYNGYDKEWVYASIQTADDSPQEDGEVLTDNWFETELEKEPRAWMDLPGISTNKFQMNPITRSLISQITASDNEQKFFTTVENLPILRDGKLYFGYEESELAIKSELENVHE